MKPSTLERLFKPFIINKLDSRQKYITRLTEPATLQSFLDSISPQKTDKDLIRLGPNGDGGYLVPNDLEGIEACFSPGVSLISGFEKDCADLGMKVFMADRSVDNPAENHELFHFTKKFIGVTTDEGFMTVDDWVSNSLPDSDKDLILQIDIEGFEYETFLNISDKLMNRFRIIVAEFHFIDQYWNSPFFLLASRAFDKILQTHTCVHIHPNNCYPEITKGDIAVPSIAEFTFYRNDRIKSSSYADTFPHPLDFDCTNDPHMALHKSWYRKGKK